MKTNEDSFPWDSLLANVVNLYALGRLSSGRAAELVGITRVEFLLALGRYHVFPLGEELKELEYGDN